MDEPTPIYDRDLLYSVPQIADFLGDITERQVRHQIDAGRLPSFKMGGRICARKSTLRRWLESLEDKTATR